MELQTKKLSVKRQYANRWLTRIPLKEVEELMGEPCTFLYHNTMQAQAVAGNHYHLDKKEVFMCTHGELEVVLMNTETGERVIRRLSSDPESPDNILLYVPVGIAHAVRNIREDMSIITVFSNLDQWKEEKTVSYNIM